MAESFNVGDIAIIVDAVRPEWIGKEVTILSALLHNHRGMSPRHEISDPDGYGHKCFAIPAHLRKKRPPDHPDNVTTWDACPWSPEKLVAKEAEHV